MNVTVFSLFIVWYNSNVHNVDPYSLALSLERSRLFSALYLQTFTRPSLSSTRGRIEPPSPEVLQVRCDVNRCAQSLGNDTEQTPQDGDGLSVQRLGIHVSVAHGAKRYERPPEGA